MSDVAVGDPFYRFDATSYVDGSVEVHMARYYMVRETPKGWWLSHWMNSDVWHVWVSKTARKRYAYPTPEEALEGFRARKRAQIRHATKMLNVGNAALRAVSEACADNDYATQHIHGVFPATRIEDEY